MQSSLSNISYTLLHNLVLLSSLGPILSSNLLSPEAMLLTMPNTVGLLNGLFSLIKYGLSDCHDGFGVYPGYGGCSGNGLYEKSTGRLTYNPAGATFSEYISDLALLLTAGRLSDENRATIEDECSLEPDNTSITRCIQQLIVSTGEFHSTSHTSRSGESRKKENDTPGESSEPYKVSPYQEYISDTTDNQFLNIYMQSSMCLSFFVSRPSSTFTWVEDVIVIIC